ncbi:MAG TPA: PAS domain S-box protein, partial [Vicinamibacteria bacterium]|nr:PAS domain S-box protein [Vicinamibacteria bacterium]
MVESPSDDLHRQFFERNRAVQLLIDPATGAIVDANPAACAFYGFDRDRLRSLRIGDINTLPPNQLRAAMAQAEAERRTFFPFRHRLASGEERDVEVHTGPVELGGQRLLYSIVHDVTDRRQAEAALSRNDEKYRDILEGIEEGYYEVDLSGNFTHVNESLCRILGRTREETLGLGYRAYSDEPTAGSVRLTFEQVRRTGESVRHVDFELRRKDGTTRHVAASVSLVKGSSAQAAGFRGVVRDVTDLRRSERLQEALYAIAEVSSAGLDIPAFYRAVHEIVGELLNAGNFYIALRDEATGGILFPYFVDAHDEPPPLRSPGKTLTDYVLRTAAPLFVSPEVFADLVARGEIEPTGSPSIDWMGVPLLRGEKAFGVLVVQSYDEGVRFTKTDLDVLTFVSRHVASALERVRARDALRESEARFRALAETAPCAIFIYQGSEFRFVNAAAATLSGFTQDELLRLGFADLVHPDFRGLVKERGFARQRGEEVPGRYEFKILTKGGEERWLDFSSGLVEFGGRSAALGMAFDITDRKRSDERMRTLAYHDPLTGLPNRLLFHDRLQVAVVQAHRARERLGVLFVDVDGFKLINDSLGHTVGDRVLEKVAERIVSCVREGDTVARLGGDEFTLVLPGLERALEVTPVAEKILDVLRRPIRVDGRELFVTASMGVSLYPDDGEDAATLVKNADTAMYRAKEQGRDQCQLYTPAMNVSAVERLAEETSLRRALLRNALVPLFRPMVDLSTGRLHGVEALVCWPPPGEGRGDGGHKSPAELAALMVPIVPWLVRTACRQVHEWHEEGLRDLRVSVRLSARQFRQPDLIQDLQQALAEARLDPRCLEIDLTDTAALPEAHAAARGLLELRSLGVRLSIDDFAIGDASLGALRQLPMDAWKVDRGLVRRLPGAQEDADVVTALLALAHALRL